MADYRELLLRAVEALPENNGAARRQVYEKARTALVTQLRAINPPLPAREITQHRLQLEDCIRQVEQAATDKLLGGFKQLEEEVEHDRAAAAAVGGSSVVVRSTPVAAVEPAAEAAPKDLEDEAPPAPDMEPAEDEPAPDAAEALEATDAAGDGDDGAADADDAEDEATEAAERQQQQEISRDEPAAEAGGTHETADAVDDDEQDAGGTIAEQTDARMSTEDEVAALAAALKAHTEETVAALEAAETPDTPAVEPRQAGALHAVSASVGEEMDEMPSPPRRLEPKPGSIEYLIAQAQAAAERAAIPTRWKNDTMAASRAEPDLEEPSGGEPGAAEAGAVEVLSAQAGANAAMSSVREVEVEPEIAADTVTAPGAAGKPSADADADGDPQGAIDRAIEALDREARGETTTEDSDAGDDTVAGIAEEATAAAGRGRGGNAVTIFLVVFALLLVGACGAGYWAWREGYVDLAAMFGQDAAVAGNAAADTSSNGGQSAPTMDAPANDAAASGPGNTTATPDAVAPVNQDMSDSTAADAGTEDLSELTPATEDSAPAAASNVDQNKTEDRLPTASSFTGDADTSSASASSAPAAAAAANAAGADTAGTPDAAAAAVPANGGQSLLLEASAEGTTGAVPYSGTVEWTRGTDELGQPTLEAHANIPARNLGVDVLIRRNSDPTLPASHLMEVNFHVTESFIGGDIASLPGILLKNEELVKGTPLVGASARVVDNSFLFALSAADQDVATNMDLLKSRKWMDLALVYGTGNRAIITLEKDADAQQLFADVLTDWSKEADAAASSADNSTDTD